MQILSLVPGIGRPSSPQRIVLVPGSINMSSSIALSITRPSPPEGMTLILRYNLAAGFAALGEAGHPIECTLYFLELLLAAKLCESSKEKKKLTTMVENPCWDHWVLIRASISRPLWNPH